MDFNDFKNELLNIANAPEISDGKIVKFIINYFVGKPIPHLEYTTDIVARCNFINENEEKNIARTSYPPSPNNISLQRANFAKQQVFYCATNSESQKSDPALTALLETLGTKIKDEEISKIEFLLSIWRCQRSLKLWVLPFSKKCCQVNPRLRKIQLGLVPLIQKVMPDNEEEMKALAFISDCFWTEEKLNMHYRITAAFYNALMFFNEQREMGIDGLMYPSCHTKGVGINLVLKKELIDNKVLTCKKLEYGVGMRNKGNSKKLEFHIIQKFEY